MASSPVVCGILSNPISERKMPAPCPPSSVLPVRNIPYTLSAGLLTEHLDLARLRDSPIICQGMSELRRLESFLANAPFRVQLPHLGAHVKDIGIARYQAGSLRRHLPHLQTGTCRDDPVQSFGVLRRWRGDMMESGRDAAAEAKETREV